ncbi:uncharacterized protein LOC129554754 [Moschus berezovskii]|uniref:uncharacterized protein LOC129554754 n=1 Tax=Moschus berezovskii TaxID=68408 RepID=UPI002443872B|nr:uncharacterized protein LOC129554754 [Moschus berezovskii]
MGFGGSRIENCCQLMPARRWGPDFGPPNRWKLLDIAFCKATTITKVPESQSPLAHQMLAHTFHPWVQRRVLEGCTYSVGKSRGRRADSQPHKTCCDFLLVGGLTCTSQQNRGLRCLRLELDRVCVLVRTVQSACVENVLCTPAVCLSCMPYLACPLLASSTSKWPHLPRLPGSPAQRTTSQPSSRVSCLLPLLPTPEQPAAKT